MPKAYDMLVVGAGLIGSLQALILAKSGLKILLLEKSKLSPQVNAQDGRGFALTASSLRVLEKIHLDEPLHPYLTPIYDIRVSEEGTYHHLHFNHQLVSTEPMGALVPANRLRQVIHDRLRQTSNVDLIDDFNYESLSHEGPWAILKGQNQSFKSKLIIAADGKNSPLRALLGIKTFTRDYSQEALVATLAHEEEDHQYVAHEHFLKTGPLAFLPLQGRSSSLVWCLPPSQAQERLALDEEGFCKALFEVFPYLGKLTVLEKPRAYPLKATIAKTFYKDRVILVGDAAHGIHPLAGQGLNLGFNDVIDLSDTLHQALTLGLDVTQSSLLQDYLRKRFLDTAQLFLATDGLTRLFGTSAWPLKQGRRLGLSLVNHLPPLKAFFMKRAMGLASKKSLFLQGKTLFNS